MAALVPVFDGAAYILPLRWTTDERLAELTQYLHDLSGWIHVMVVDGSAAALFDAHARVFPPSVRHIAPAPRPGANGKVAGIMTGVALAGSELLVLADDDVRYDAASLTHVLGLLDEADIVRPQNYFLSLPWHARWDTARTLMNRAFAGDYPGTFAVRRSALLATDGYDGDVLFENLELLRTIKAAGGREMRAPDVFIGRLPPDVDHFLHQRIRQAYDDFAQPGRLCLELVLLPLLAVAGYRTVFNRRPALAVALLAAACTVAEAGRRRTGGAAVFPPSSALWAGPWLLERAVCVWAAVVLRSTGGVAYAGKRLRRAATPPAQLQKKHAGKIPSTTRRTDHGQRAECCNGA